MEVPSSAGGDPAGSMDLEAEFDEMLGRTQKAFLKNALIRSKAKLVPEGFVSEAALQTASEEDLLSWGLLKGDVRVLKVAFPSPVSPGQAGTASDASGAAGVEGGIVVKLLQELVCSQKESVCMQKEIKESTDKLAASMTTVSALAVAQYADELRYSPSQATVSAKRSPSFKIRLVEMYQPGCLGRDGSLPTLLRCMLTNRNLVKHLVIGGHLFKHAWYLKAQRTVGIPNVNHARNGFLVAKPIEQAFDAGQLVFEWKRELAHEVAAGAGHLGKQYSVSESGIAAADANHAAEVVNLTKPAAGKKAPSPPPPPQGEHPATPTAAATTGGTINSKAGSSSSSKAGSSSSSKADSSGKHMVAGTMKVFSKAVAAATVGSPHAGPRAAAPPHGGSLTNPMATTKTEHRGDVGMLVCRWLGDEEVKFVEYGCTALESSQLSTVYGQSTFKTVVDGVPLTFLGEGRPYYRCLSFQARKAIKDALASGRIEAWPLVGSANNIIYHSSAASDTIKKYFDSLALVDEGSKVKLGTADDEEDDNEGLYEGA